ncbi:MAG TPA: DMT family transporter [Tissierellia bacterium]|nr:DMT family transporter [Tissierellia bacterium]
MNLKNKSILLMLFSSLTFSAMQIIVKLLPQIPLMEKVFFRNFICLIIAYFIIKKNIDSPRGFFIKNGKKHMEHFWGFKENRKYLFYRYLFGFTGLIFFFYATTKMLAADAAILNKLSPVFVMILAHFLLKEEINKTKVLVLIISVLGALLVIKPQFNFSVIPALSGFISAILSGAAYIFIRLIGDKESPYTTVFYFSLLSSLSCIPFFFFEFALPNFYELLLLILLGLFAALGQIALTFAYRGCPASEISIYDYSNIIFSSLLGYFFLKEVPDWLSIIGGLLIISSSFYLFVKLKN